MLKFVSCRLRAEYRDPHSVIEFSAEYRHGRPNMELFI